MTAPGEIELAETEAAIRACFPVMVQLRPTLTEQEFVDRVQRQRLGGYRLAALRDGGGAVLAVAGFVLGEKLAWGRHLYVDDLVTDAARRGTGAGHRLLDWLAEYARQAGCKALHLDSGRQRLDAHRFYRREGMTETSAHFAIDLAPTAAASHGYDDWEDPSHEGGLDDGSLA